MPSSSEPRLLVRSLSVDLDREPVLRDVSFGVGAGEFVVLLGPNGGGKTTLLRTIAGFESPVRGDVRRDGSSIVDRPAHRRGMGMVFQDPALFPGRTVWENVAYGLEIAGEPAGRVTARVGEMLKLLHIDGLAERDALSLSGGERQRVALARTLAPGPSVVLLDEPFASVDPELRTDLRADFRSVLKVSGASVLHVTHDREEGLFLGDRVLLLFGGRLIADAPPRDLFARPPNASAARFLGYNLLRRGEETLAVHPSEIVLGPPFEGVLARVEIVGPAGTTDLVIARLETGERVECRRDGGVGLPAVGERVGLTWRRAIPLPVETARGEAQ